MQLQGDEGLFKTPQTVIATEHGNPDRPDAHSRDGHHDDDRAARAQAGRLHGPVHRRAHRGARARRTSGGSAPTSSPSRRAREDRLRRLAPLARADGREQLHPRLARGPRRGGAARGRRGGRVRADLARGPPRHPRGARGDPGRAEADDAPVRARLAHRLVAARAPARRAVPRRLRRPPLHRLDVPAAARRAPSDDDPRPRAAPLSRNG